MATFLDAANSAAIDQARPALTASGEYKKRQSNKRPQRITTTSSRPRLPIPDTNLMPTKWLSDSGDQRSAMVSVVHCIARKPLHHSTASQSKKASSTRRTRVRLMATTAIESEGVKAAAGAKRKKINCANNAEMAKKARREWSRTASKSAPQRAAIKS